MKGFSLAVTSKLLNDCVSRAQDGVYSETFARCHLDFSAFWEQSKGIEGGGERPDKELQRESPRVAIPLARKHVKRSVKVLLNALRAVQEK